MIVKPDQLIKRRGKLGLIKVDVDLNGVREWLADKMNEELEIGASKGKLTNFIVEPFVKHEASEEFYVRYKYVICTNQAAHTAMYCIGSTIIELAELIVAVYLIRNSTAAVVNISALGIYNNSSKLQAPDGVPGFNLHVSG